MSKFLISEITMKVTEKAVQLLEGNEYLKKFPVERIMRDTKITEIHEELLKFKK
ncbi:acyl-CoA dehydrogenase family protein [Fusobacterium sp.]|uniref:acyl-CoA dehydrogenase family protein n=1 Tax=Fusobacterium sp. TaxID=68766 RepID=UPI0028FDCBF0|nr:acyl-CoA dehydrogenase family protein [Fusobacterium sp.]MDU1911784.1 acyl-CoA dehydrogenase family protein [Fusobacterium sp.]